MKKWTILLILLTHVACSDNHTPCIDQTCKPTMTCDPSSNQCVSKCTQSADCMKGFDCDVALGQCYNITQRHCAMSLECKRYGRCSEKNGRCVVISDQDCITSLLCKNSGECSANTTWNICEVTHDKHCQQSMVCKEAGRCRRYYRDEGFFYCGTNEPSFNSVLDIVSKYIRTIFGPF